MLDDYKLEGPTKKLEVVIEEIVVDQLATMSAYKKLSVDEIVNTAVRRFIGSHKDFFPPAKS